MSVVAAPIAWAEANQRYLCAVIDALRSAIQSHVDSSAEPRSLTSLDPEPIDPPPALVSLAAVFGLSPFECDLLAMCAAVELDAAFARACADANGDPRRRYVTFGLALAVHPDAHWSAIVPGAPLRRWRLIDTGHDESLAAAPLRIDERVLHHLTGLAYLDTRLDGIVETFPGTSGITDSQRRLAERAMSIWTNGEPPWPAIQLCGRDNVALATTAQHACEGLGLGLLRLRAENIPSSPSERTALTRLCERELALGRTALLLAVDEDDPEDTTRRASTFAEEMSGPLLIGSTEPLILESRARVRLDVDKLDHEEQRAMWHRVLGPLAETLNGQLDTLVTQFDLDMNGIRAAADMLGATDETSLYAKLWDACRVQARRRLDDLAQRISSRVTRADLVLPRAQLDALDEIAIHVRNARMVYEEWGFGERSERGLGISALFAGPSGTGKTLAAEVLANELRLDLYRIDLSQVVSKYIGETEKNLRRVFSAAEQSGAILLFDEADALFGKRSEVKDSHDRYANIEVGYLLQRMEAYRGLAILTTNMKNALDQAFLRRLRFVVQFPFPDSAQRLEIWKRVFPVKTPTDGLDLTRLSKMSIAGGNIRNIAMNAAFLAANERTRVTMAHIGCAARSEYAKLEKTLSSGELGGTR